MPKPELLTLNPYQDERGMLKKVLMISQMEGEQIEEVYLLYSAPGSVRGNHYHKKTVEYFTVVQGTAQAVLMDMATGQRMTMEITAQDDKVLKVPAGVAHAFVNPKDQELILLAISSAQYDSLNTDTYKMVLVYPK